MIWVLTMALLHKLNAEQRARAIDILLRSHLPSGGYSISEALPRGLFGQLFLASPNNVGQDHIIAKCPIIFPDYSERQYNYQVEQMLYELEKAQLYYDIPWIQRFFDVQMVMGWPFVMSRWRHGTLRDLIENRYWWETAEKIAMLAILSRGLNLCAARGLLAHQDLKPENIFFDDLTKRFSFPSNYRGLRFMPKIADFGLADAFSDLGINGGSRPYLSPEQYDKGIIADGTKIDVFALGVIGHECLTDGMHPIGERTIAVWPLPLPGKGSKWVHENIWKGWARRPKDKVELIQNVDIDLADLLAKAIHEHAGSRPTMIEFEDRMWRVLERVDPARFSEVKMQVAYFEEGSISGEPWERMEERIDRVRKTYSRRT
jgi:serine/threonine protein kinase